MKALSIFIVLVFMAAGCLLLSGCSAQDGKPDFLFKEGYANFSDTNLSEDNLLHALNGEWSFVPGRLLEPSQPWPANEEIYIKVPLDWGQMEPIDEWKNGVGVGTYRLRLLLNQADVGRTLGLYVKPIASAYRLWVDGQLLREVGSAGSHAASTIPREKTETMYWVPSHQEMQIHIQVSNFNQRKGGIWSGISMGSEKAIQANQLPHLVRDSMSAGALFMMGIFYLVFAWLYIPQRSTLYLGLLSILLGLRTFFLGETLVAFFFPSLQWEWQVKLEYGIEIGAALAFNQYVCTLYPEHFARGMLRAIHFVYAGFIMLVLLTPALIFTEWLSLFAGFTAVTLLYAMLFVFPKAIRHKRLGARSGFVALMIAFLAVLSDTFYYLWVPIAATELIYGSFFIFLFTQMAVTIRRYIVLKQETFALTLRLAESNEELEQKITHRSRQLTAAHLSNSRLLHNIAHDLNAPISLIHQQSKQLKPFVQAEGELCYSVIEQQAGWAMQLAQNLNDLARLQENEMNYQPNVTSAEELLRFLYKRTEPIIRSNGFQWVNKPLDELFQGQAVWIKADLFLMERVFDNLASNALKYAAKGREVKMDYSVQKERLDIIFENEVEERLDEALAHLFERFYQYREDGDGSGSGLGLAVCREIIRLHEGFIHVNQPNPGRLQLIVTLPIHASPIQE